MTLPHPRPPSPLALALALALALLLAPSPAAAQPAPPDPVAAPAQVVAAGSARITVLADGLVRIEQARAGAGAVGAFDDLASFSVVNRRVAPAPAFSVARPNATAVVVTTSRLRVTYDERGAVPKDACGAATTRVNFTQEAGTAVAAFPAGTTAASAAACCALCGEDAQCTSWTFLPALPALNCFLLVGAVAQASPGNVFGSRAPAALPPGALRVDMLDSGASWTPEGGARVAPDNLGGSNPFLDCYSTPMECVAQYAQGMGPGLLSRAGWAFVDDTDTGRLVPPAAGSGKNVSWWAAPQTDAVDWYFGSFGAAGHAEALAAWAAVSGAPAVPPRAALGVWWSRYFPYSAASITDEVLQGYRDHALPLSYLVLDMGWHNNYFPGGGPWGACTGWGGFDPNTTLFADFGAFAANVTGADGVVLGHPLGLALNLHLNSGIDACQLRYKAVCDALGLPSAFDAPVLCDLGSRAFADALFGVYLDAPPLDRVGPWWNDMGGCGSTDPQLFMNHLFFEHAERDRGGRGLTFARYGDTGDGGVPLNALNLGMQRYPMGFTGDTFEHEATLSYQVEATAQSANVLFGWHSHDIGGNHNGVGCCNGEPGGACCPGDEDPSNFTGSELLLRWVQFGALSPILRTHCGYCERRAWVFERHAAQLADALRLRNALVPYLYSEALREFLAGSGKVPVRPLYHDFAGDAGAYAHNGSYLVGGALLAAPTANISIEGAQNGTGAVPSRAYLPAGARWAAWSDARVLEGPRARRRALRPRRGAALQPRGPAAARDARLAERQPGGPARVARLPGALRRRRSRRWRQQ